jgi:hypothetical protein
MNSTRSALIPAALGVALLLLAPGPGAAAKAPAKCARAGSTTIVKSKTARVYEVDPNSSSTDSVLYGCLYSQNKRVKLGEAYDDDYVTSFGYRGVRLAGRYVAYAAWDEDISCKADCPPGYDSRDDWVVVWDLDARKARSQEAYVAGQTLKVNSAGAAAWLQRLGNSQREVHAWDSAGHRVLDTGPISSKTFALNGPNLTWVNGDVQHTVPLS